jgi:hypothetical protein
MSVGSLSTLSRSAVRPAFDAPDAMPLKIVDTIFVKIPSPRRSMEASRALGVTVPSASDVPSTAPIALRMSPEMSPVLSST